MQPVIKWSGSKRMQSGIIKTYMPDTFSTYYEPFVGGGSMLYAVNPPKSVCGDICVPLIDLWNKIKNNPEEVASEYEIRWKRLKEEGYMAYYAIRDDFNQGKSAYDLLFLSRTCINGLIRFNRKGEFNSALHHSRPGIHPDSLRKIILNWSEHIQNTDFFANDYIATTANAKSGDIVYLDPPYFHTKGQYFGGIDYDRFLEYLSGLNDRGIKYILSFDGKRGEENYIVDLPKELYQRHILIPSGNSTFKKVMSKKEEKVSDSLYLNY